MTKTQTEAHRVEVVKFEDHEGSGECGECGRTGLRWLAVLSTGGSVGTECAKKLLGYKPSPKNYQWVADYTPIAEYDDCGARMVLWQHKRSTQTATSQNGHLLSVGGARCEWLKRGWVT